MVDSNLAQTSILALILKYQKVLINGKNEINWIVSGVFLPFGWLGCAAWRPT